MTEKRNLFLIDDFEELVEMMEEQLNEFFNVNAFSDYESASKYLKEHAGELDIVISDFKMPIKNGVEVLTEVAALNPQTVRIILTGYADEKLIKNNPGVIHAIMDKNEYTQAEDLLRVIEKADLSR